MSNLPKPKRSSKFPKIRTEMLGRLADEAELRTLPPSEVDWEEIHRMAAEARRKA